MKAKYKITPQINKRLQELADELPQVPHFILTPNGKYTPKQQTKTKRLYGQELMDSGQKVVNGEYVSDLHSYLSKKKEVRMMNHIVNMRKEYGLYETAGVVVYMERVRALHAQLEALKPIKLTWWQRIKKFFKIKW
jgi:hypothetical protein